MDRKSNSLNWFEIPVLDLARAKKFYESIFAIHMEGTQEMMGMKMAAFPWEVGNGKANGALVQSDMHKPSMNGVVVYLNANPQIQAVIDRIEPAGGKMFMMKTEISPEMGFMAFFLDTEGNKMALHAQK